MKLGEKEYSKEFGYINENSFNKNLIMEALENYQKEENHQYLILKIDKKEDFLKTIHCQNDIEFYFIYILSNNLINRIGKIIHQNDMVFQFLFSDLNDKLDIKKYKLYKDKIKNEIKCIFDYKNIENSLKTLNFKKYDIDNIIKFSETFINSNMEKIKELLGEKKL